MKITSNIKLDKGDTTRGKVTEVKSLNKLAELILKEKYSMGLFKDSIVKKANFVYCEAIALDFDKEYTLKQAKEDFSKFQCIIATTKSHRKEKNGEVHDRFRVIVFLT